MTSYRPSTLTAFSHSSHIFFIWVAPPFRPTFICLRFRQVRNNYVNLLAPYSVNEQLLASSFSRKSLFMKNWLKYLAPLSSIGFEQITKCFIFVPWCTFSRTRLISPVMKPFLRIERRSRAYGSAGSFYVLRLFFPSFFISFFENRFCSIFSLVWARFSIWDWKLMASSSVLSSSVEKSERSNARPEVGKFTSSKMICLRHRIWRISPDN